MCVHVCDVLMCVDIATHVNCKNSRTAGSGKQFIVPLSCYTIG